MKVFVLGGYGKTGIAAVKLLVQSTLVTEIAVAGRNLERAEKTATEIGEKAIAIAVDGTDEKKMTLLTAHYDVIINAADNKAVIPSIRAAIHNGAHYCDMAGAQILEDAKQYAPAAEAAGISAIIATGISPCITNLMGVHTANQLIDVEQLQVGRAEIFNFSSGRELSPRQWLENPQESLVELLEYKSFLAWALQMLQQHGSSKIRAYHDGQWDDIDPIKNGFEVPLAQGNTTTGYPYFSGNDSWGMLPCDLAKLSPAEVWFSPLPPQLDSLLREQSLRILERKVDSDTAVNTFYATVESDPQYWLTIPDDFVPIAKVWVRAVGYKEGQAAQHTCWFTAPMWDVNGYFLTSVALVASVFKILRGEVQAQGIMLAEKAFEPKSFFEEVIALFPEPLPDGKLINESFKWLY